MKNEDFNSLPFADEFQKALTNLWFTQSWLDEKYRAFLKPFGITLQQYNFLGYLKQIRPGTTDLQTIKNNLIEPKADATRLLSRLVQKDLVLSKVDPSNKRKIQISLTEKGLNLIKSILETGPELNRSITYKLTVKDAKALNDILAKLRS